MTVQWGCNRYAVAQIIAVTDPSTAVALIAAF
jgi:hypothetical protein